MHELSIAMNLLGTIQQYAIENNVSKVNEVTIRIGKLQAIVPDSLLFMYDQIKSEFPSAKNSVLKMEFIDIKTKCQICNKEFIMDRLNLICPNDSSHYLEIIEGNELIVESMDIDREHN